MSTRGMGSSLIVPTHFPLHSVRHSWATWALQAGKNIRWVADQLGHADASTTLNHYAHAMPDDETDLSFLELNVAKRRYTSPRSDNIGRRPRKSLKNGDPGAIRTRDIQLRSIPFVSRNISPNRLESFG